jgi:hypothetical protein
MGHDLPTNRKQKLSRAETKNLKLLIEVSYGRGSQNKTGRKGVRNRFSIGARAGGTA